MSRRRVGRPRLLERVAPIRFNPSTAHRSNETPHHASTPLLRRSFGLRHPVETNPQTGGRDRSRGRSDRYAIRDQPGRVLCHGHPAPPQAPRRTRTRPRRDQLPHTARICRPTRPRSPGRGGAGRDELRQGIGDRCGHAGNRTGSLGRGERGGSQRPGPARRSPQRFGSTRQPRRCHPRHRCRRLRPRDVQDVAGSCRRRSDRRRLRPRSLDRSRDQSGRDLPRVVRCGETRVGTRRGPRFGRVVPRGAGGAGRGGLGRDAGGAGRGRIHRLGDRRSLGR